MKRILQHFAFWRARDDWAAPALQPEDLCMLAPLAEMLNERRPEKGLLTDIEAEIDIGSSATAPRATRRFGLRALIFCFLLGGGVSASILSGYAAMTGPTQQIIVRPALDQSWLQLGEVALEGKTLRSFVAAKCEAHSHLLIELSGYDSGKNPEHLVADDLVSGRPVMAPDEKILMACNF
ncbi:hypothetical protein [uncultured Roseobacter sp.]|uniref:hypothetical protein n=1 Tax=uncultured Roseobacter sp. TaxID=114847 RepID=UPI00262FF2C0|nr:hypothetical protein [uncultured Roseobacter sp.]